MVTYIRRIYEGISPCLTADIIKDALENLFVADSPDQELTGSGRSMHHSDIHRHTHLTAGPGAQRAQQAQLYRGSLCCRYRGSDDSIICNDAWVNGPYWIHA